MLIRSHIRPIQELIRVTSTACVQLLHNEKPCNPGQGIQEIQSMSLFYIDKRNSQNHIYIIHDYNVINHLVFSYHSCFSYLHPVGSAFA